MIVQEKIMREAIESQEIMFSRRFNAVLSNVEKQLRGLGLDCTALDSITCDLLPNVSVYVDYAVRGFSCSIIEIERVDVLNSDDDHLPKAENKLMNALQCIILELNEKAAMESLQENAHSAYVMYDLYY